MKRLGLVLAFCALLSLGTAQAQLAGGLMFPGPGTPASSGAASVIKMIQQGSCTIASSAASCTYTVSPAITNTANAILIWNGTNSSSTTTGQDVRDAVRIAITNTTTITATRGASPAFSLLVNFTVVEFASGVNSIQAGTISIPATSGSTNTASVTTTGANVFVLYEGCSFSASVGSTLPQCGVSQTTSAGTTTVTATVLASATVNQTVGYMVVDLGTSVVTSAQQKAVSMTTSNTSDTDTLSSAVVVNNASLMYGGSTAQVVAVYSLDAYSTFLTNTTTVTKTRGGVAASARTVYYTAIEWASAALNSAVQRNSTFALSSQTSNSATISSVNTAKAFVNWTGFSNANVNPNVGDPAISLAGATSVTATLNASGSVTIPFEVVEFK